MKHLLPIILLSLSVATSLPTYSLSLIPSIGGGLTHLTTKNVVAELSNLVVIAAKYYYHQQLSSVDTQIVVTNTPDSVIMNLHHDKNHWRDQASQFKKENSERKLMMEDMEDKIKTLKDENKTLKDENKTLKDDCRLKEKWWIGWVPWWIGCLVSWSIRILLGVMVSWLIGLIGWASRWIVYLVSWSIRILLGVMVNKNTTSETQWDIPGEEEMINDDDVDEEEYLGVEEDDDEEDDRNDDDNDEETTMLTTVTNNDHWGSLVRADFVYDFSLEDEIKEKLLRRKILNKRRRDKNGSQ
jgi:hypothetical protein